MKTSNRKRIFRIISFSLIGLIICTAVGFGIYVGTIEYPSLNATLLQESGLSVTLNDITGKPLNHSQGKYGKKISIEKLPQHTKSAFLAAEDKRFYSHKGFDYKRMASATIKNITAKSFKEGASTISQQLIKNTHLSPEKTLKRKLKEAHLTKKLEKKFSKDNIFNMYLNCIYFGNGAYGLNTASHLYFDKDGHALSIAESAFLAGVINSPSRYNPWSNFDNAKSRQKTILNLMLKNNAISQEEHTAALEEPIKIIDQKPDDPRAFVSTTMSYAEEILNYFGIDSLSGTTINTYFNPYVQKALSTSIAQQKQATINKYSISPEYMGIIIDAKTRGVTAYTASSGVTHNTKRQPASTLKPFAVYLPALEQGLINPATPLLDEPTDYGGYRPQNYNNRHEGWISTRQAVKSSNNVVAVKLLDQLGVQSAHDYCSKVGLDLTSQDNNLSVALGGINEGVRLIDLTNAYATLADNGKYAIPSFIKSIISSDGKILYEHSTNKKTALREDSSYLMTDMLKSNALSGTASRLKSLNFDIAAKTGTGGASGQKSNDAYCISYTTELAMGVWLGSKDSSEQNTMSDTITGSTYPTIITKNTYQAIYAKNKPQDFNAPNSVFAAEIDKNLLNEQKVVVYAEESTPTIYRQRELFSIYTPPTRLISSEPNKPDNNLAPITPSRPDYPSKAKETKKRRKGFINKLKRFFGSKSEE